MKNNLKNLVLLAWTISGMSCTPTLKLYYGVHDPRHETPASVSKYAQQRNLDGAIILIPKDTASYLAIVRSMKANPDLYLFSSTGVNMKYSVRSDCNEPVFEFAETICTGKYNAIDTAATLSMILNYLKPLTPDDSLRYAESQRRDVDYTTLITWAKYIGYLNKDHVRPWLESLSNQKECKVNCYLLNMDFVTTSWSKEEFESVNFND
ncbi:MAG: hypothetical protein KA444_05620 [Bacteroidia bacterium]|nr:hypothetical protein [Bacteroidia bacterium]